MSKKEREKQGGGATGARPEDFMDEEDLAELKASKTFKTSDAFSGAPASGAMPEDGSYSSAVANSLNDLVQPGSSKIGERMMVKMGWRQGQGVGPRVSYARHKEQLQEASTSMAGQQSVDAEEEDDSEEAKKHTYAPIDRPLYLFDNKENQHGLGYKAGLTLDQRLGSVGKGKEKEVVSVGGKQMPLGGAFGISALEDADEDDYDVYSSSLAGPNGSKMLVMDEGDEDDGMYGSFGDSQQPELLKWQDRSKRKEADRNGRANARGGPPKAIQKFSDGTPVLQGFVLAQTVMKLDQW